MTLNEVVLKCKYSIADGCLRYDVTRPDNGTAEFYRFCQTISRRHAWYRCGWWQDIGFRAMRAAEISRDERREYCDS